MRAGATGIFNADSKDGTDGSLVQAETSALWFRKPLLYLAELRDRTRGEVAQDLQL